jgi:hypothetical protein
LERPPLTRLSPSIWSSTTSRCGSEPDPARRREWQPSPISRELAVPGRRAPNQISAAVPDRLVGEHRPCKALHLLDAIQRVTEPTCSTDTQRRNRGVSSTDRDGEAVHQPVVGVSLTQTVDLTALDRSRGADGRTPRCHTDRAPGAIHGG